MRIVGASSTVKLEVWRAVEAQHRVSTMVLVKTLEDQHLLERILESSKPSLPEGAAKLHWLLFTPFRYPSFPGGSRFRSPADPGVFYGADEQRTACAELGYWRWRFMMESGLDGIDPMQQTLFRTALKGKGLDLRLPPHARQRKQWTAPADYSHCQKLARQAREDGIDIIRYESVRDPRKGGCAAVLHPRAFSQTAPVQTQTWTLMVSRAWVRWQEDSIFPGASFEFDAASWQVA